MKTPKNKWWIITLLACVLLVMITSYTAWNQLDPIYTCAQCHEIKATHEAWLTSAHAEVSCTDCHGTALSNGLHSLKEKAHMVVSHFTSSIRNEDITLTEDQILDISARCIECHRSEHAGWLTGGHAVTYKDIFLDEEHNKMERPYADCLRCHGMFYDGTIKDLMTMNEGSSSYTINDKKQMEKATIPCLACHLIHTESGEHPKTSLYVRAEKMHIRTDYLTKVNMQDKGRTVLTDNDPNSQLCIQCHSPNAWHQTGSEDDRTPTGVHEGLSCLSCHKAHTNDTRTSCDACHPALSNCGLDVKTMNTTYKDAMSPNNIHHITCASCHEDRTGKRNVSQSREIALSLSHK